MSKAALPPRQGPLTSLRVLDLGVLVAGPLVGCFMSDLGADVVKIERPGGDPARKTGRHVKGESLIWKYLGRNKRSMVVDFRTQEGRDLILRLSRAADVVVENFRPGTLEKWGLGWEDLHKVNPQLVMVRISGFGQHGPYRTRPGFGTVAESMSGFTHLNGWPDGPPTLPPVALADTAAAMAGTIAALAALINREHTGQGELIDVSLIEPLFGYLGPQLMDYWFFREEPRRVGNRLEFAAPRGAYQCKDGKWLALSGATPQTAARIFEAIGHAELNRDPRFATNAERVKHADEIDQIIGAWTATVPREEALRRLNDTGAPVGPVYTLQDTLDDEHFQSRPVAVEVSDPVLGSIKLPNVFAQLATHPGKVRFGGRPLDADRDDVLAEWLGEAPQSARESMGSDSIAESATKPSELGY
jgi:crotonobetainyl-CoA:carnitine CoA-transferase CaiB-like acyl-CoA transferase